jgi:hypothetical protein
MSIIAAVANNYSVIIPPAGIWGGYTNNYITTAGPTGYIWTNDYAVKTGNGRNITAQAGINVGYPSRNDSRQEFNWSSTSKSIGTMSSAPFISPTSKKTAWSMVIWFKVQAAGLGRKIIGCQSDSPLANQYDRQLWVGTDQKLYFGAFQPSSTSALSVAGTDTVNLDQWYMATVTLRDGVYAVYLNDLQYQGGIVMGTADDNQDWRSVFWCVGGYKLNGWPNGNDGFWTGSTHSIYIWERQLTTAEINLIYAGTRNWSGRVG